MPLLGGAPHDLSLPCSPFHLRLPGGIFVYWFLYCLPLAALEHQPQGNKSPISPSHCCVPAPGQVSGPWWVLNKHLLCELPPCWQEGASWSHLSFFVRQAAKGGTVKATSGFNAAEDAQTLRKAMKGLGKCPTGGEHPLCVPHPRVAQRALCPQANVCLTLRKHSGDKVTFQGKLEGRVFYYRLLNVMNSFWTFPINFIPAL